MFSHTKKYSIRRIIYFWFSYAIYFSESPYRTAISGAVLKMQEEGTLHKLKTRWWKEKYGGGKCEVGVSFLPTQ